MRLILAAGIFGRISIVEASLLLWIGGSGRHRILVEDVEHPLYEE